MSKSPEAGSMRFRESFSTTFRNNQYFERDPREKFEHSLSRFSRIIYQH